MASIQDLERLPYYYKNATRATAETILRGEPARVCIVRPSTQPGACSVSWSEPDGPKKIKHSLIDMVDGWYVTEVEDGSSLKFAKMETLLEFLKLIPFNSPQHKSTMNISSDNGIYGGYEDTLNTPNTAATADDDDDGKHLRATESSIFGGFVAGLPQPIAKNSTVNLPPTTASTSVQEPYKPIASGGVLYSELPPDPKNARPIMASPRTDVRQDNSALPPTPFYSAPPEEEEEEHPNVPIVTASSNDAVTSPNALSPRLPSQDEFISPRKKHPRSPRHADTKKLSQKLAYMRGENLDGLSLSSLESLRGTLVKSLQRVNLAIDTALLGGADDGRKKARVKDKVDKYESEVREVQKEARKEKIRKTKSRRDRHDKKGKKTKEKEKEPQLPPAEDEPPSNDAVTVLVDDDGNPLLSF